MPDIYEREMIILGRYRMQRQAAMMGRTIAPRLTEEEIIEALARHEARKHFHYQRYHGHESQIASLYGNELRKRKHTEENEVA